MTQERPVPDQIKRAEGTSLLGAAHSASLQFSLHDWVLVHDLSSKMGTAVLSVNEAHVVNYLLL